MPATAIVFQKVNYHLVFRVYPMLEAEDTKVSKTRSLLSRSPQLLSQTNTLQRDSCWRRGVRHVLWEDRARNNAFFLGVGRAGQGSGSNRACKSTG